MQIIIDCTTKGKKQIIRRLRALKSTISADDGGEYWQERTLSQVWLETTKTADEVEDWLERCNLDAIGACEHSF